MKGPATTLPEGETDIIDEAITTFRANVLFKNFEVNNGADRTMIYLTLYIQLCLKECERVKTKKEAKTALFQVGFAVAVLNNDNISLTHLGCARIHTQKYTQQLALKSFSLPGDPGWSLGGLFPTASSRDEAETFKSYIKQARTECSERVLDRFYEEGEVS